MMASTTTLATRKRAWLGAALMLTVMPTVWTNCDVGSEHRMLERGLRTMRLVEHLKTEIPAKLFPVLEAATTMTVLTEVLRGTTAGSVTIPNGTTGEVLFHMLSAQWASDAVQGDLSINVVVDRSFDGGMTFINYQSSTAVNPGSSCVQGPLPGGKTETCTFRVNVGLDGVGSVWRWTITPSTPFVWGADATF